jgi:hypothetical protein
MGIISGYPKDTNISLSDKLLGTDAESSLATKNYEITDFVAFLRNQNIGSQGPMGPQGVQGNPGTPGAVGPAGLEWQGTWNKNTSYVADDAVAFSGSSYFCILAIAGSSLNQSPPNDTTHWALLASQGAQGIQGIQGPTGSQGPAGYGTLQQTVDLGNTVTSGSTRLTLTGNSLSILNTTTSVGNTLLRDSLRFNRDDGFGIINRIDLSAPFNITANRSITLPNASGTVALTSDFTTKVVKTTITQAQILQMFTTPIPILNSTTAGIAKIPLNILCKRSGAGTAYTIASNQFSLVSNSGNTFTFSLNNNILSSTVPVSYTTFSSNANFQIATGVDNEIYKLGFYTSNPTDGTGDMDVYVTYIEFAL